MRERPWDKAFYAAMLLSVTFLETACGAFGRDEPSGGAAREEDRLTLLSPSEELPKGAADEFAIDFTRHSVPYSEIRSGRPPKDDMADQKITTGYHIKTIPASTPITAPSSTHLSFRRTRPQMPRIHRPASFLTANLDPTDTDYAKVRRLISAGICG